MKKIVITLFSLILLSGVVFGQTTTLKAGEKILSAETPKNFVPVMEDSADAVYINYDMTEKENVYFYSLGARLWYTTVSALTTSPTVVANSQYSLDGRIYVDLDTVTYYGASSDTTFHFVENSTRVGYPYLRLKLVVSDDSLSTQLNKATGRFIK